MTINVTQDPTTTQAGQSEDDWIKQAATNGWSNPQDLLSSINKYNNADVSSFDPSSDPTLKKLLDQGYLSPVQQGGSDGGGNSIYGAANTPQSAKGWAPAFFQQDGANYKGPVIPGGTQDDPLYGKIAGNAYLPQSQSMFMDKIAPMIPLMFMGAPGLLEGLSSGGLEGGIDALGAGAGQGSGLAKFGAGLVQQLGESGGKVNPLSFLSPIASGLGVPSWMTQLGSMGVNLAQGRSPNPMNLISLLSRFGGLGGGTNNGGGGS